jgi:hypothetical protein
MICTGCCRSQSVFTWARAARAGVYVKRYPVYERYLKRGRINVSAISRSQTMATFCKHLANCYNGESR